jgi:D-3-phosphoglycerate dehydrogenase
MSRPIVYVTQPIHPDALALLRSSADVRTGFGTDAVPLDDVLPDVEGFLLRYSGIPREAIENAPGLRAIARAGAGYENLPVNAARERGIPVLIPRAANSRSVAEHVFALLLAVYRSIPYWDGLARSGRPDLFELREGALSQALSGKTLGLVGIGGIGSEVARIGRDGFLMDVLAYHPRRSDAEVRAMRIEPTRSLDELLGRCDAVSVQVPLTDETRGMLGADQFRAMKPTGVLVNVARGGIVDEAALASALAAGELAGAGVDVWADKVPKADNPLLAAGLRVVATPHRAGRTEEAQRRAGMLAADGLLDALAGRTSEFVDDVTLR